jgi:hypothetical protein
MGTRIPKALLIGENAQGSLYLAKRLQVRGLECSFATSYQEACSLLRAQGFDLVLSPMRLRGVSFFSLIGLLEGSGATLFYSHAVEESCWWLPALRHGERCFGSSALRPSEFVSVLDETIAEIQFDVRVAGNAQQSPVHQSALSVFEVASSRQETLPADPACVKTSALAKHKGMALKKLAC